LASATAAVVLLAGAALLLTLDAVAPDNIASSAISGSSTSIGCNAALKPVQLTVAMTDAWLMCRHAAWAKPSLASSSSMALIVERGNAGVAALYSRSRLALSDFTAVRTPCSLMRLVLTRVSLGKKDASWNTAQSCCLIEASITEPLVTTVESTLGLVLFRFLFPPVTPVLLTTD
jgi:hypothetical protein